MTLEELLNKLIERWRKPLWYKWIIKCVYHWKYYIKFIYWENRCTEWCSINDLCSIESWMRQFVCEKGLVNLWCAYESIDFTDWEWETYRRHTKMTIEYRIMLSSIQQEKEDFILSNIKI